MKRKIHRAEMSETVVNLSDLGFTVPAIGFMVKRTPAVVYYHLKEAKRLRNGNITRRKPKQVTEGAKAAIRKMLSRQWVDALDGSFKSE